MEKYIVTLEEVEIENMPIDILTPYFRGHRYLREQWQRASDGVIHRERGPALSFYGPGSGNTSDRSYEAFFWMKDGLVHRQVGVAFEAREPNYGTTFMGWCREGKLHNENGDALRIDDREELRHINRYFFDGVERVDRMEIRYSKLRTDQPTPPTP